MRATRAIPLALFVAGCAVVASPRPSSPRPSSPPSEPVTDLPTRQVTPISGPEVPTGQPARPFEEVRALWVVRSTMTSAAEVTAMVEQADQAGFNTVLVQVRGRADAFYSSSWEPRGETITEADGFDPLALTIDLAHARGIAVHAWVNTHLVWGGAGPAPRDSRHIVRAHPEWLAVPRALSVELFDVSPWDPIFVERLRKYAADNSGTVEGVYTSPSDARVKERVRSVWLDLASRYDLDGIHFDYIRFPDSDRNTITNSTINGNLIGIYLTAQSENNSAHYNNFFNNSQFGVNASSDSGINATDNWWGHKTGPYHATNNSDGEGENVTDHVVFDPWVNDRIYWIPTVYLDLISPNPAIHLQTVQFRGHSSDEDKIIRYVWRSSIDGELSNGTNSDHSTNELSVGEHTIFFKAQNENGNWSEEVTSQFIITNKPVAKIESITPNPVLAGERVIFKANSTDEDGTIDLYHWSSSIDGVFMQSRGNQFYNDSMSSGVHEIFHKVQDNNGIWSDEVSMDLTIAIKPVASIQSITPNPALTTHDIEFSAQVTICDCPGDIQEYVWNSSMEGELYRGEEHQFSMNGLSEGNHTISLQIQDNNGFWSDVINETLLIVHKPVVQIGEITPDPALEMAMTTFSIAQLDCRCGPDNITTYNWRSDINGELYNGSNMSFTYYGLFKGNHSIFLVAQDSNGFWSDEVSTTLEVKGRPYITGIGLSSAFNPIYTPDSPGVTHNFTIDATDDDGWITRYAITTSLDGEIYNGTNPYFETANLSVGEHTIFFKAMNNEGIWSSWRIHAHPLVEPPRNHIPTISIEAPSNNENVSGTILIRMVVDDVDGNISRVYVSVDGGIWYPPSGDRWNYTLDTGTLTEGTHTISVKSYDGIHYSNITTITINVEHLEDDDDDNSFWLTFGIAFIVTAVVTFTLIKLYSKK